MKQTASSQTGSKSRRVPGMGTAIDHLRQQLIDIGKRNRLTNAPVGKDRAKQLDIEDERSDEVFKILYLQGRKMYFEAYRGAAESEAGSETEERIFVPGDAEASNSGPAAHHIDSYLQTRLTAERLQKRLLTLFRDAEAMEEEQGISVLFLALGFLRWYESESSELERFAPLILLPVDLERDSARGRFKLSYRDQDLEPNLSLKALLKADFDLVLPDLPEGSEWMPSEYFQQVRASISSQPRWRVHPDTIELSFYSFAKFLMWKDLEAMGAETGELLEKLLVGGFDAAPSIFAPDEDLDQRFSDPRDLGHILDADTSQTQVIAAARSGTNLVVQGPPGTGKSQTIANIIAAVAQEGKRVLFVAEKRAALDVVHVRLEKCGLGPLCMELHSHKANRKQVYGELKRTLELGEPKAVNEQHYERVRQVRDDLNRISSLLHRVDEITGETPYGVIGRLAKLDCGEAPRPDFRIPGADGWRRKQLSERLDAVASLAALTRHHGGERSHAWRGTRKRLSPMDRQRLAERLPEAIGRLGSVQGALEVAAKAASVGDCAQLAAVGIVVDQLNALASMPGDVPGLLESNVLVERPTEVVDLCEDMERLQTAKSGLLEEVVESALELPWDAVRLEIAVSGMSLFRVFNGRYRESVARLRSVLRGDIPKNHHERLAILDRLLDYRNRSRAIDKRGQLGRDALGYSWRDEDTDLSRLLPALRWIGDQVKSFGSGMAVKRQIATVPEGCDLQGMAEGLRSAYTEWLKLWQSMADATELDLRTAFITDAIEEVEFRVLLARLRAWAAALGLVESWHRLATAAQRATELGLDEIRQRLADGRLSPDQARDTLEFIRAEAVWNRMRREEAALDAIDGRDRSACVEEFKELDAQLQELASQEVALRHFNSLPAGSAGMVGIVRGEANKKTRHMRIRKLLDAAGEAVLAIKPVFLMSPLSVAQYLTPGKLTFDVLLIDEASQVRPADAVGAICRAKQVIVVGDQKQMPPTSFFDRQLSGEESHDLEAAADLQAAQVGDMESILSLCEARGMPGGMLRWHYRSQHPSLIQVSNHEFYDDALICPPSPDAAGRDIGMSFVYVDGEYQRGKQRNNPREAQAVAEQVLAHARKRPDETLGVVALSVAQRDTIRDTLEYMRTEYPELDAFCREGQDEAFFVKNLENVQGDERDVMFISIGYGKDAGGYMSQSFGPVSSEGGERRLNVLFTRARKQSRVFASIRHSDIRLDVTRHAGPRVLKRFLKFAETGEMDVPVMTGAPMDSPFEESVALALQAHGYRVEPQVGSSGFKIDLAVYHPDDEGRFLLAVECDGARYHSSSWARERDRLRQAVLERKGWRFHRIWSTDWFYERESEMAKLLDSIERAQSIGVAGPSGGPVPQRVLVERKEPALAGEPATAAYTEVRFAIPESGYLELHEAALPELMHYVVRIVTAEGPVHIEEVARRLSRLWGHKRTGRRIQTAVEDAAHSAAASGLLVYCDEGSEKFLTSSDSDSLVVVRNRSKVDSASLRNVEMLPSSEINAAVLEAVRKNIGISVADCATEVARMFGYKSTRADLRQCLERHAQKLVAQGRLTTVDGQLRLPQ